MAIYLETVWSTSIGIRFDMSRHERVLIEGPDDKIEVFVEPLGPRLSVIATEY